MKVKEKCIVISQDCIAKDIYSLWLKTDKIAAQARPGQFVSVYCNDGGHLLPRPISLCEINQEKGTLRLVYRVVGKGTEMFAALKAGDSVEVLGPLGNGFPMEEAEGKRVFLIGGGIGVPPMLETAKQLKGEPVLVMGYRDELFLTDEMKKAGELVIATEDGSAGTKGNVLDAIRENDLKADMIFACGPKPMLRALKAYGLENNIPCYVSMEERMACGVGACLGCVCQSTEVDDHSQVKNKRVCKDGPGFYADEIDEF